MLIRNWIGSGSRTYSFASFLASTLVTTLLVCFIIFLAVEVLPGDAATQRLGLESNPEKLAELRDQYGLDDPILLRFSTWVLNLLQGDLGSFIGSGQPILNALLPALGRSLLIVGGGLIVIIVLGIIAGIWAGLRMGSLPDRFLSTGAVATLGIPDFIIATVLVLVLATTFGLLPAVSLIPPGSTALAHPEILVLPSLTLGLIGSAYLFRQTRAAVAQQAQRPHVIAARLSGIHPFRVVSRHLLPGALGPIGTALAVTIPSLLGGSVVIERVFAYPGVGTMMVSALGSRDATALMACALVLIIPTVIGLKLTDLGQRHQRVSKVTA